MTALRTTLDVASPEHLADTEAMRTKLAEVETEHAKALAGGGEKYVARHHHRGKLLARERVELLLDPDSPVLELCPLAGWGSGFTVGAGLVTGIGVVSGVECLIVAKDPTCAAARRPLHQVTASAAAASETVSGSVLEAAVGAVEESGAA